jgi:hypothetical protein
MMGKVRVKGTSGVLAGGDAQVIVTDGSALLLSIETLVAADSAKLEPPPPPPPPVEPPKPEPDWPWP